MTRRTRVLDGMRGAVFLLVLLVAGCVQPEPQPPEAQVDADEERGAAPAANFTVAEPPLHPVGRAWTYRGRQEYNPEPEFTVVVADAGGDGYLLAGSSPKDLVYEALWGNPLYGRHDRALNRIDFERPWLSFPLYDGKSWAFSDTLTVTARRATIATPMGTEDGFVIEGANDRVARRWEYSPALGVMTRHVATRADGTVVDDHALASVAEGSSWVWYQLGDLVAADAQSPVLFEVPDGFDEVIVSAGGTDGARVDVRGPNGEAWSGAFEGAEEWRHGALPATPGHWTVTVAGQPAVEGAPAIEWPIGWGYAHVAPVRWIPGG